MSKPSTGLNNMRHAIIALGDVEFSIRDFPFVEGLKHPNRALTQLNADLNEIEVVDKRVFPGATRPIQVYRNVGVRVTDEVEKEASVVGWAEVWPGFFKSPMLQGSAIIHIMEE